MRTLFIIISISIFSSSLFAQKEISVVSKLNSLTKKGDYAIIEVRLNNEDEFRTIEGSSSSLARIAVFTGNNQGAELLSKGFDGVNAIVTILNKLKEKKWKIINVYSINGESLIITHYIMERTK